MEATDGSTHPQDLRDIVGKFHASLTEESAWNGVQHLFVPNADKHEILQAIAHCHIASFEAGNEYLSSRIGQAHIDSSIRCLLGKLTSEARDAMLKDSPVLMRAPKPLENAFLQSADLPSLVLTLSETGLRLPLDQRHAGDGRGDSGLRTQEAEQLLTRIQSGQAKRTATESADIHTPQLPNAPDTHTDHWLSERLEKFQPHFSARRDTDFSLNGKVNVDGEEIVCRHIAALWEEDFLRTAGKPTYQALNSPAALQEAAQSLVQSDIINRADVDGARTERTQYWMSSDWGRVLTENFDAMSRQAPKGGAVCRTLYLVTPKHAMALGLKIKDRAGARRYVVQLYDPNRTVAHQRSAITAQPDQAGVPAEIRKLQQHDFLPAYLLESYLLTDVDNRSIPALFFGEKLEPGMPRFAGELPDLDGHVMQALLYSNLAEQLHACADQLSLVDSTTRLKILTSENHVGVPGLYYALRFDHAEVITALGEILKACQPPLLPAQLMVLLSGKNHDGSPGLHAALLRGNAGAVKAFGKLLKTCEPPLSSEQLMAVLSAHDREGFPGLYDALWNGHTETVKAFGTLLKTSEPTLSSEQLMVLLSAKSSQGFPGLYSALLNGHAETVAVFGELLKACQPPLSPAQLMVLLSANSKRGIPGLYVALQQGHTATTEAFAEMLKAVAPRMTPEQFLDLLLIKLPDGSPAVYSALRTGDTKWIEGYGKLLEKMGASLPTKQLAKVLSAKSSIGGSALHSARESGHVEAAAAFDALKVKFAPPSSTKHRVGQAVRQRVRKWLLKISSAWSKNI